MEPCEPRRVAALARGCLNQPQLCRKEGVVQGILYLNLPPWPGFLLPITCPYLPKFSTSSIRSLGVILLFLFSHAGLQEIYFPKHTTVCCCSLNYARIYSPRLGLELKLELGLRLIAPGHFGMSVALQFLVQKEALGPPSRPQKGTASGKFHA
jgi:hypothetical protein